MSRKELKYFIFGSIISADNDEFDEDTKQAIIARFDSEDDFDNTDWEYVLEPIKDKEIRYKLIKLLKCDK